MSAEVAIALAAFAAALLGVAAWAVARRAADRRRTLHQRLIEQLHDEVWELKEAAAARDRAEAASEAKSRFLATVSHEIRTPLNGILGLADLLRETGLDSEQTAYVEAMKSSGQSLAALIDEILDLSRIEAGKLELESKEFDVVALIEGVVELMAPRAQGKGLEIAASTSADVPRRLVGDAGRLRQVLINLAGNAVKFTSAGGVGVSVGVTQDGRVRFAVADTGPGVPPDRRAAIFEDFEQADSSTTRQHGGTGLGLAISRRLVERMGGALSLASAMGEGSTFAFDLPLAVAATLAAAAPAAPVSATARRALVVARSPFEAPFLAARLADAGVAVTRADSPEAALDALAAWPAPDLVIVDCALGEDAAHAVAAAARVAGVAKSLVLFSPFERRALGEKGLADFDGWLVKPVRARSLLARLANEQDDERDAAAVQAPALRPAATRQKVLLAEDNDINALIVMRFLGRIGAQALRAENGLQAVAMAEAAMARGERPFDVILMDIRMPGLDGCDATRRIRSLERARNLAPARIVAVTANAFEDERQAALSAGVDEFLVKPLDLARLAEALDSRAPWPAAAVS